MSQKVVSITQAVHAAEPVTDEAVQHVRAVLASLTPLGGPARQRVNNLSYDGSYEECLRAIFKDTVQGRRAIKALAVLGFDLAKHPYFFPYLLEKFLELPGGKK